MWEMGILLGSTYRNHKLLVLSIICLTPPTDYKPHEGRDQVYVSLLNLQCQAQSQVMEGALYLMNE